MKFYKIHFGSIKIELQLLEEYVKEISESNRKNLEKYNKELDAIIAGLGEKETDYKDALEDSKTDLQYKLGFEFPNFSLRSNLVQLYSIIEHNLNIFCSMTRNEMSLKFSAKELRGSSDLDKSKLYLKRAKGVNLSTVDKWNEILSIRAVRNKIIHNNSLLSKKDKHYAKVKELEAKTNGFTMVEDEKKFGSYVQLQIQENQFLSECIKFTNDFFSDLASKLEGE